MMRELSRVLEDLHDGLVAVQTPNGLRLSEVAMTLPLELRPVFRDGGCVLLAELPRHLEANAWTPIPSRLQLAWSSGGATAPEASP